MKFPRPVWLLLLALTGGQMASAEGLEDVLADLGGTQCETGELTCVTLAVPRDQRGNDPSDTIDITFAVSLATEQSEGILFYAVGGPGGSGLAVADGYLAAFDPSLTENMDVVFFDQRGVGPVNGLTCPKAQGRFDTANVDWDQPEKADEVARAYATDCGAELENAGLLDVVDTDQAIRDLEAFRLAISAPKVWIYGESYGTQFAQQYATAFPEVISGVILDGVVDLNLSFKGFYAAYTEAAARILTRVLEGCSLLPGCSSDMQGDAAAIYDALAARLDQAPAVLDFPLGDGSTAKRSLTASMLETNAFYALYDPDGRGIFLRALAAASHDDLLPMLRLGYSNLYLDPQTLEGLPDPTWFGAAYYAITCADYAEGGPDERANARDILKDSVAFSALHPRLSRSYMVERLVCAHWPRHGSATRPEPFAGGDYPTLILNSTTDPITPVTMAYSVMDHVKNGHLVVMDGGPHVIWGRGLLCPDQIVAALLFDGSLPEARELLCKQDFITGYKPLTMTDADDAAEPFLVAVALETELYASPELAGWDGGDPLAVGCDHGGTVTLAASDAGSSYAFDHCAWWPGLVFDGVGFYADNGDESDGMTLDLAVSGTHEGKFTWHHNAWTEAARLNGTYDGREVSTPRWMP